VKKPALFLLVLAIGLLGLQNSFAIESSAGIDKNNLLQYVFSKKWSLNNFPCNSNGGTYMVLSNDDTSGEVMTMNGKSQGGNSQKATHKFTVTGNNSFTFEQTIYTEGNQFMENAMHGADKVVSKTIKYYRLVTPKRLEYSGEIRMINLDVLMKNGYIQYDKKPEQSFSNMCEGSLEAPILAPLGRELSCTPNQAIADKVLRDTGKEAFSFGLSFTATEAKIKVASQEFILPYRGDFGEPNNRAGDYKSESTSMSFYYKNKLSIIQEGGKIITAGICK
jgi:hypothetical protein